MKIEAVVNEPFHLLTIGGAKLHARALPMAQAMTWAREANAAKTEIESAANYEEMGEAIALACGVLRDYPEVTEGLKNTVPAETWERMTVEQVRQALEGLLEVNDPFVSVRREKAARQAEAEERGIRMLELMPETERGPMIQRLLQTQSATSPENSELTLGE